jgi:hypothetical protein
MTLFALVLESTSCAPWARQLSARRLSLGEKLFVKAQPTPKIYNSLKGRHELES